ncbi:hypothetical protein [Novosphingopyxis sp. YJ-S2-01]|uniref:hypothetical protein n=1 Tax=Novosphingopyxis sp. YJ-S2-01 TaxID=2794021 RepID=UPI0018DD06E8|nr:hypothetical protein [Novosphingopyxis sp. YJ-S2-01]MBH9536944.1 hypothetical protein [Novosphingopyxis sp. YJ-S2-01]
MSAKTQANRREKARAAKAAEIAHRGGRCLDCGKTPQETGRPLEFDHRPGTVKVGEVARMVSEGRSVPKIEAEMAKCDLRCQPDHADVGKQRIIDGAPPVLRV